MKYLKLIATFIFLLSMTVKAQTGLESGTQYGIGEDSAKCVLNYSLFSEYAKQKNYADAYEPWMYCFENAPQAGKGVYIYGVYIVKWEIKNAQTKQEKEEKIEKLMTVYDMRIKYYGDDKKRPADYLLGLKAIDYHKLKKNDLTAQKQAYDWLKQSIDGMGESVKTNIVNYYMVISFDLYASSEIGGDKLINDYEMVQEKLDVIIKRGGKNADAASNMKTSFEQSFANSGAADCDKLEEIYSSKYEANPTDEEQLSKIIALFDKVDCTESELYYKASESLYKIKPSAKSAAGIAKMYLAKNDASKAIEYYKKAIELETDDTKKADELYTLAYIVYSKNAAYVEARKYAKQALSLKANWGAPYILIGKMYAQSAQEQKLGDKDIENQSGYWAAVDMFNKAKRIDSECATEANQNIKIYTNYFPTKEEIFFDPDCEVGKSFKVGGWIGTTTTVRSRD